MKESRIHSLDNLKWRIVWLMVIFHTAMCYMAYAPEWWYVVDGAQPLFSATAFVCWTDIFIMPVMFFISGYFGIMSLSKRGTANFWRSKLRHIVAPWLFGSIVIAPFIAYLTLATRHSSISFWEFYTRLFWGPYYQQAHYWYLGVLSALYVILAAACRLSPRLTQKTSSSASFLAPAVFFLISLVSIGVIGSSIHPDTWSFYGYVLVLQPVRIPTYIAVFFLGVWAWRARWFTSEGFVPSCLPWSAAFLVTGMLYLWQKLFLAQYTTSPILLVWSNAFCQSTFTVSALFALLSLFHRRFNRASRLSSALASTSYGVYYLHQPILFPLAWLFTSLPLSSPTKFLVVSTVTLAACVLLSRHVLNRLPAARGCFQA